MISSLTTEWQLKDILSSAMKCCLCLVAFPIRCYNWTCFIFIRSEDFLEAFVEFCRTFLIHGCLRVHLLLWTTKTHFFKKYQHPYFILLIWILLREFLSVIQKFSKKNPCCLSKTFLEKEFLTFILDFLEEEFLLIMQDFLNEDLLPCNQIFLKNNSYHLFKTVMAFMQDFLDEDLLFIQDF